MNARPSRLHLLLLAIALAILPFTARADAPSEIRLVYPGVGVGNRPTAAGNAVATMHLRGMLEEEFKKDGIKISWSFLRAGPAGARGLCQRARRLLLAR
jgi:sulfonate transport system substrate-binding protein